MTNRSRSAPNDRRAELLLALGYVSLAVAFVGRWVLTRHRPGVGWLTPGRADAISGLLFGICFGLLTVGIAARLRARRAARE